MDTNQLDKCMLLPHGKNYIFNILQKTCYIWTCFDDKYELVS